MPGDPARDEQRILRIWQGAVMVLQQNCEIRYASANDSRVLVAPLVFRPRWPEGPWIPLAQNRIPGYFYLPAVPVGGASALGLPDQEWPESVVAFASTCVTSRSLVKSNRRLALSVDMLPHLHESVVKFYSVRGFAKFEDARALVGKEIVDVRETNQSVPGPSRLLKVYLRGKSPDEDDEATVTDWGVRA
jgi:hypothetical protein